MPPRTLRRRPRAARLSTPWHLARRCDDECNRDEKTPFALLVVEPGQDARGDARILDALRRGLRRADIAAAIGTNRYAVLLTGAGRYDAGRVVSRIRQSQPASIGVAVIPAGQQEPRRAGDGGDWGYGQSR